MRNSERQKLVESQNAIKVDRNADHMYLKESPHKNLTSLLFISSFSISKASIRFQNIFLQSLFKII